MAFSHHLLLHAPLILHAARLLGAFHHVPLVGVAHVSQAKWATAVRVALELGEGLCSVFLLGKLNDTSATGATSRLVLNLCALDFADGGEELDEIVVASAPRKLCMR